ncbi:hypothetical protein FQR65_LT14060 [Abscondita terminalis]|nr:hypothetical protein FQR65_LT14060 [Abscondita terminalis]
MNKIYTEREKVLLATLIKDNAVVENKKTDGATLIEKHRAWEFICRTYNAQPEVNTTRTLQQLKKLWNNLKQRKRKETTALKYDMLATGGGPPKKPVIDPVLQVVEEAAPSLDVTIISPYDSIAVFENERTEAESTLTKARACESKASEAILSTDTTETNNFPPPPSLFSKVLEAAPSCDTTTTRRSKRSVPVVGAVSTERDARVGKLKKATQQQEVLFNLRKQLLEEEIKTARHLTLKAAEEQIKAVEERELTRKKLEVELQKAEAERELAFLKLQAFREKENISWA